MSRRRIGSLVFLALGLGVAYWLGQTGPQDQHVHVILGDRAPETTGVGLTYASSGGDVANETSFHYDLGKAPRIVSHDPKLPRGDYQLKVDVDTREGRKTSQKQVTLKGGSAQIDVSHD